MTLTHTHMFLAMALATMWVWLVNHFDAKTMIYLHLALFWGFVLAFAAAIFR